MNDIFLFMYLFFVDVLFLQFCYVLCHFILIFLLYKMNLLTNNKCEYFILVFYFSASTNFSSKAMVNFHLFYLFKITLRPIFYLIPTNRSVILVLVNFNNLGAQGQLEKIKTLSSRPTNVN